MEYKTVSEHHHMYLIIYVYGSSHLYCNLYLIGLAITEEMVTKKLKPLKPNKSGGMDGINTRVLLEGVQPLKTPIAIIMSKTLSEIFNTHKGNHSSCRTIKYSS